MPHFDPDTMTRLVSEFRKSAARLKKIFKIRTSPKPEPINPIN